MANLICVVWILILILISFPPCVGYFSFWKTFWNACGLDDLVGRKKNHCLLWSSRRFRRLFHFVVIFSWMTMTLSILSCLGVDGDVDGYWSFFRDVIYLFVVLSRNDCDCDHRPLLFFDDLLCGVSCGDDRRPRRRRGGGVGGVETDDPSRCHLCCCTPEEVDYWIPLSSLYSTDRNCKLGLQIIKASVTWLPGQQHRLREGAATL